METDGTRSPDTMDADASSGQDEDDTNWFLVARKKKRLAQAAADLPPPPAPQVPRKTNARLPPLPIDDYKIVFRPRDGLNLGAWPQPSVARAIGIAAGLDSAVLNELIIRIRTDQNLAVLSTPDENLAARLQRVQFICMGLTQHAVQAYVAAPDNSCKGVVSGLEPNTTTTTLLENLRCSEAPVLHARMMGPTNTALITFSGTHVPHYVRMYGAELRCHIYRPRQQVCSVCLSMGHRADVCPMPDKPRCAACGISNPPKEHECTPKCIHCDGAHPATDPRCPSRQLPAHNKSHVLREHNKRKEQRPPPGPAQGQLGSTTQQGAQQNPTQSEKTPGSSAENPWTRGRSRTRGSTGDRLQTDRSRSAGGSKGRTPSHGRSRDRGHNKKGSDKKEQAVSWAAQFPPLSPSPHTPPSVTQHSKPQPTPQPMTTDNEPRLNDSLQTSRTVYCTQQALNEMAASLKTELVTLMQAEMQKMKEVIMAEVTAPLQQLIQQALQPAVQQMVADIKQQIAAALGQLSISPPLSKRSLSPSRETQRSHPYLRPARLPSPDRTPAPLNPESSLPSTSQADVPPAGQPPGINQTQIIADHGQKP
ncbi:uncharacterized protein LOC125947456 [Dermacentor silvarum]|uniref:uncharacterized protein LOC125947456 n=1 Tax=Dermacentor silvarum TaxID=543639 RepID=UPI002101CEF4|nr:uncharacterized protein LOC125947456 [Dermacentor silvarum]